MSSRLLRLGTLLGLLTSLVSRADDIDLDAEVSRIIALDADVDFGEYLAGECASCHAPVGAASQVPVVQGARQEAIVRALLEFQRGVRDNETMRSVAAALVDEDIAAVSLYLSGGSP